MYKNDMVAVVKNGGKILREQGSTVYLPFGSEYSIYLKNLRSRKAKVKISIDGQDVLNGSSLLINGNSELELERFLEDMDKGNRFRYIQKTEKIQDHRGDKIDDGIVRIEFQYEREIIQYGIPICTNLTSRSYEPSSGINGIRSMSFNSSTTSVNSQATMDSFSDMTGSMATPKGFKPLNDEGITVKGSVSSQKFTYGSIGILEDEKHVITLQLKGETSTGNTVVEALTVKSKLVCETCGTKNDNKAKFCAECGTALI